VKAVAEAHGGSVGLSSLHTEGSDVWLRLPHAQRDGARLPPSPDGVAARELRDG
jgi:hypothetical protein